MYVTQILAELYYLVDEEGGIPSPKRAAALLGPLARCIQREHMRALAVSRISRHSRLVSVLQRYKGI